MKARLGCWILLASFAPARAEEPTPAQIEFFEKKVRPVLVENCFRCHSAQATKLKGKLRLDSRAAALKGGETGPAVVPGHPAKSLMVEGIGYKNVDFQMPPDGKLPDSVIADLTAWIKMGAPWPKEDPKGTEDKYVFDLAKRKKEHWAWQPTKPLPPPAVKNAQWPLGAADRFILARLEEKGLQPAPSADRRTLIRRVSFDLLGLPPTPADVETFVKDQAPDAYAKVVDRLLASPHFGERWGRHWLDLVRYAESRGHEFDYTNPNAYQYRDYVIRALNADLPYDQFVTEHIAGDLLPRPRLHPAERFNESILATGFWFMGEQIHSPVDICQDKADRFDNMLDVFGKTFLGLTVACARCHDHKFDAISTKDYYALSGFLESSRFRLARFDTMEHNRQIARKLGKLREKQRPLIQKALAESLRPGLERLADYLLAAREVSQGQRRPADIAAARKLDVKALDRWVVQLNRASKDPLDPLHPWAALGNVAEVWRTSSDSTDKIRQVIVDFARLGPEAWRPDGVAFGSGPARPGDVRFSTDPARPITRIFDRAAAERDPIWNGLKPAPGAENDPEALGRVVRAGRTLHTPTFDIHEGKIHGLVKGTGQVFASVEGHVMIAGPLHGGLIRQFKAGPKFQWLSLDLSAYKGRRAHLEFTPTDGGDFAVAKVVEADAPPAPAARPNALVRKLLTGDSARSPASLAAAYQRLFLDMAERLASDRILVSADAPAYAQLADWLVERPELLASSPRLADVARPLLAEQAKLIAQIKNESRLALAILDGNGVNERVFLRGAHKTRGELAPRQFLEALVGRVFQPHPPGSKARSTQDPSGSKARPTGSGRLELARQMTDPAINPFLPRVMVNRVWHHLFGRGIVASVDNFGVLGDRPTHPELLDHLADQFVKDGWSVKKLIRSLVLSRTYQMSSQPNENAKQIDAQNLLLHRMRLRRLEGEAIRDAMLAVSGRLDRKAFGPATPVYLTEFQQGRGRPASGPLDGNGRRSIYLSVRRNFLPTMLLAFDTPTPFSTVGRRTVSNVPAQALILLNDPFVHQQAEVWAKRVLATPGSSKERITQMFLQAFSRPPTDAELRACLEFLEENARVEGKMNETAAWTGLCHVLFNMKEFIFVN